MKQQTSPLMVPAIPEKDKKIIKLHPDVHKELGELIEYKGETYNDIVKRLIKYYKDKEQQKK